MEYRYKHNGKVKAGKLVYDNSQLLQRHLMSLEGESVEVVIRKKREPATADQLNFYVGIILTEAHRHNEFIHYPSPKKIHDQVFAPLFLEEYTIGGSTRIKKLSELSRDEVWDLTERSMAWLKTEFDIEIGNPDNYHIK